MKTSVRIHIEPFKSSRVQFNKKEQTALNSYAVKTATNAAVEAWRSVKKDSVAFAKKLQRVHRVMVKGNSPKSLFSKWLKSVGIPRATAYWTLKRHGVTSKKQPSVKQLLKMREELELKLSKVAKGKRDEVKTKLDSIKRQLSTRRERLENKLKAIGGELKAVMTGIAAFSGSEEIKSFDIDKPVADWLASNELMLRKMSKSQLQEFQRAVTNTALEEVNLPVIKKPAGSVRSLTAQHPIATA
jgi:hypothetical protein